MPDDVKISEMSEAASLDNSAQFPYVQLMNGDLTTLKAPLSQIGTKINEGMTFSNLQTTSKNIVGAINDIDTKTTLVKSASGSLIHITDGGDNIPLKACEITIAPDLTGHTESNLFVCGKNLVVASDLRATATHDSVTFTKTGIGRFNVSGTNGNTTYGGYLSNNASILLKAGHTYRISGNWSGLTPSSSTVRVDLRYGSTIYLHENTESFTPTEDVVCYLGYRINANYSVPNGTICSPYVTVDNSDTTYEVYNGNTYTFTFGQTVYGGHFDNKGNLVVTHGFVEFDGSSDEDWHLSSTYSWNVYINIPTSKPLQFGDMLFCKAGNNIVPTTPSGFIEENKCNISTNRNFQIGILGTLGITTLEDWRTWLSSNHIKVAFTLETPTSLSLTGVNPKTISGVNNIYNDCGSTAIEYFTSSADEVAALIEVLSNS